jgi:hypothetical protein
MVTSVTKGRTQKLPQKIKIVENYWHDHSLESSWELLSVGIISFLIQPFSGEGGAFHNFSEKNSVLNSLKTGGILWKFQKVI